MLNFSNFVKQSRIDIFNMVDISSLSLTENRGYSSAILLGKALPREYIQNLNSEKETDYTIFSRYEHATDELADALATIIQKNGYKAISQSEHGIEKRKEYDEKTKTSILPHKKIAVFSGLGWIGKNNLLITEKYGAALSLCSVLTNMPLDIKKAEIISGKCGNCNLCIKVCPVQAIYGKKWTPGVNRDEIVDVYKCVACLKCLAGCRYSIIYSMS